MFFLAHSSNELIVYFCEIFDFKRMEVHITDISRYRTENKAILVNFYIL